jgi:hypothetical protein
LIAVYAIVIIISGALLVTGDTSKHSIIIGIGMTIIALIPFTIMLAAENGKILIVMIPGRRHPTIL